MELDGELPQNQSGPTVSLGKVTTFVGSTSGVPRATRPCFCVAWRMPPVGGRERAHGPAPDLT